MISTNPKLKLLFLLSPASGYIPVPCSKVLRKCHENYSPDLDSKEHKIFGNSEKLKGKSPDLMSGDLDSSVGSATNKFFNANQVTYCL